MVIDCERDQDMPTLYRDFGAAEKKGLVYAGLGTGCQYQILYIQHLDVH